MELSRLRNGAERRLGRSSSRDIGTRLPPVTFSPSRSGQPADWNVSLFFSLWSYRRDESRSEELRIRQTAYGWFRSRVISQTASVDSSKVSVISSTIGIRFTHKSSWACLRRSESNPLNCRL